MNEHCKCESAGWCSRHQMNKTVREVELCKGVANTPDCGKKYWLAFEQGKLGATAPPDPILNPTGFCNRSIGFGGTVSRTIEQLTAGAVKPCGGCKGRAATLNHWLPGVSPPVLPMEFTEHSKRHLAMHIWPTKNTVAWRWNCEQILRRKDVFTGRRVVAIAKDSNCDPVEEVKESLRDLDAEFLVVTNVPSKREGTTFIPLHELIEEAAGPTDLAFYCHAKGSRHGTTPDDQGSTIYRWTSAMYETLLDDLDGVLEQLQTKATVGSFRRVGMFTTRRNNRWHYSGTFRWARTLDFFQRNWRYLDKQFFAAESHVGHMYKLEESGVIVGDNCGDLYTLEYWRSTIEPQLAEWRARRGSVRQCN